MVTKWKRFLQSPLGKGIAILFTLVGFVLSFSSLYWAGTNNLFEMDGDEYLTSSVFKLRYVRDVEQLLEQTLILKNPEWIRAGSALSEDELQELQNFLDSESGNASLLENEAERLRNEMIRNQLTRYNEIAQYFNQNKNFLYEISQADGTTLASNLTDETGWQEAAFHLSWKEGKLSASASEIGNSELGSLFTQTLLQTLPLSGNGSDILVETGLRDSLIPGDTYANMDTQFAMMRQARYWVLTIGILSVLLFLISFIWIISVSGRRNDEAGIHLSPIDRIPLEITSIFFFISMGLLFSFGENWFPFHIKSSAMEWVTLIVFLTLTHAVCAIWLLLLVRLIKAKKFWRSLLTVRILLAIGRFFHRLFHTGPITYLGTTVILGWLFINTGLLLIMTAAGGSAAGVMFLLFLVFNVVVVWMVVQTLSSFAQLKKGITELREGNLAFRFEDLKLTAPVAAVAQDVGHIRFGMAEAVDKALRSERMRTELITNVSHDLKTPLTSIINYVDLLKHEVEPGSKAAEYIQVLAEKSERLKVLIHDLLDATRASSGNVNATVEELSMGAVLQQAIGEYEDKLENARLDMRLTGLEGDTRVMADGTLLGRVVENLLSNVVKYAQKGSRVYIELSPHGNQLCLSMKNISEAALDMPVEQLMERFVRGDTARTGDGSGLGLNIAESLVSLMGGTFQVHIDGDLFKVTVCLPKTV